MYKTKFLSLLLAFLMFTACAAPVEETADIYTNEVTLEEVIIEEEAVALAASPAAQSKQLKSVASGKLKKEGSSAVIDYSNCSDGYVMVKYTASTSKRLKVQVKGPKSTYTYNISPKTWNTFPLSEGNGSYTVTVYSNVSGTSYATVLSSKFDAKLKNPFSPFLYPNQYVDYSTAPNSVKKAAELCKNKSSDLEKVAAVYDFVVDTLTYDTQKASTVKSGYLPAMDKVLQSKKGICFDYAALMAGMLRSQGIPCKLVVGYAGSAYHAWINVWSESSGWIDGAIYFDGKTWKRMDPTFASSSNRSSSMMTYIGNGSNYSSKYLY